MNRVVHFEIQAENPEKAAEFYTKVFGWNIQKWEGGSMEYWMIMTAPKESKDLGINGGLLRRSSKTPSKEFGTNAFVCTMDVENFDETAKKIVGAGGVIAMPKYALPGMAWQGYFLDPEGNTFGIHQVDKDAK